MASLHFHPSQVAAAGRKWPSFTPAGWTRCQQSLGVEWWNCSLTWKRLHGFSGRLVCIFGKLNGYISPSASPPDCELHIKLTDFGPTDNQFQLRADVSSAGGLLLMVDMGLWRGYIQGLNLGYEDTQIWIWPSYSCVPFGKCKGNSTYMIYEDTTANLFGAFFTLTLIDSESKTTRPWETWKKQAEQQRAGKRIKWTHVHMQPPVATASSTVTALPHCQEARMETSHCFIKLEHSQSVLTSATENTDICNKTPSSNKGPITPPPLPHQHF